MDEVENLWHFYDEHAAQARQHEDLRATVTSTLSAISAAVIGLASVGGLTKADVPAGVIVVILSVLGVLLSLKHYERTRMHAAILGRTRGEIDRIQAGLHAGSPTTSNLRKTAVAAHTQSARMSRVRLHLLWVGLPVGIGIVGLFVIALSLIGVTGD